MQTAGVHAIGTGVPTGFGGGFPARHPTGGTRNPDADGQASQARRGAILAAARMAAGSCRQDGTRSRSGSSGSPARTTSPWRADPRNRSGRCHQLKLNSSRRTQQNLPFVIRRSPAQQAGHQPGRRAGHPLEVLAPLDRDLPARLHLPRRRRGPAAPARGQLRPGSRADPGHHPGTATAPARHRHPANPARPGPPAALVGLATPPPAPRPPSPPALERLRRDNTMITTNYSCRNCPEQHELFRQVEHRFRSLRGQIHSRSSRYFCFAMPAMRVRCSDAARAVDDAGTRSNRRHTGSDTLSRLAYS